MFLAMKPYLLIVNYNFSYQLLCGFGVYKSTKKDWENNHKSFCKTIIPPVIVLAFRNLSQGNKAYAFCSPYLHRTSWARYSIEWQFFGAATHVWSCGNNKWELSTPESFSGAPTCTVHLAACISLFIRRACL